MIRFKLFSEITKNDIKEAVSLGGTVAATKMAQNALLKSEDKMINDKEIFNKLSKEAKKLGVQLEINDNRGGLHYFNPDHYKSRKNLTRKIKELRKINPESASKLMNEVKDIAGDTHSLGKDAILTNKNSVILAHELGHAHQVNIPGRKGSKLGKITRGIPVNRASAGAKTYIGLDSFRSGMKDENNHQEGQEVKSGKERILRAGLALAAHTPILLNEADASRTGLKLLKKAGANKNQLKSAARDLTKAWGTYATDGIAKSTLISEGSYQTGRGVQKWRNKRKKDEESKKD